MERIRVNKIPYINIKIVSTKIKLAGLHKSYDKNNHIIL